MRFIISILMLINFSMLQGCLHKGPNPDDPYESINRKTHAFNMVFDRFVLKPPAKLYKAILPAPVRMSINNFYENINEIPTVANDLLQGDWHNASNDAGRFVVNTTFGLGGLFDVAEANNLPKHKNDLGLTFAKWGDKKSPYFVIPLLGPSTIRDATSMVFEYPLLTPYPYIDNATVLNTLIAVRYVDVRANYLDKDHLLDEALDKYGLIRDAYLQHRHFMISGEKEVAQDTANDSDYVDEEEGSDYVDDEPVEITKKKPS